jgi:hypothetical protein
MHYDLLEYAATQVRNRETFLLNYGKDFGMFDYQFGALRAVWSRIGTEKDLKDQSHVGLLLFANILFRHAILGFQHIASYQSFVAWLMFRPGLEAILFLGKFVDNPANAKIWQNRLINRKDYQGAFSGRHLISKSLPKSSDFRRVLTRLNDDFMHPNPYFTHKDMNLRDDGPNLTLEIQFFDVNSEEHEGHLLAYLNLLDLIRWASESLVNNLFGPASDSVGIQKAFAEVEEARAANLAARNPAAKKVMEEFGLWQFNSATPPFQKE